MDGLEGAGLVEEVDRSGAGLYERVYLPGWKQGTPFLCEQSVAEPTSDQCTLRSPDTITEPGDFRKRLLCRDYSLYIKKIVGGK